MSKHDEFEPDHISSSTDHVLTELRLFGFQPRDDEPDPRPIPEDRVIVGAAADIFDALIATMADTGLDADLDDLLWSTVNAFHRVVERVERMLDDNERAQKQGAARTGRLRGEGRAARSADRHRAASNRPPQRPRTPS
jgi:hypothetical protein